ncbi:hypothetical protein HaLaN_18816 [Haematococcus lacustris]|uniref:Uncharacterized protein n=1 Tax=Haematococcus lacustris TaxID=44745 RepID=A0A699ZPD1_HAELA|nr:hypothetical protein HaLaN_18816 [Haematococcus lacustris]
MAGVTSRLPGTSKEVLWILSGEITSGAEPPNCQDHDHQPGPLMTRMINIVCILATAGPLN